MTAVPLPPALSVERTAAELEELWTSLTGMTLAKTARVATLQMVESPKLSVPLLRERLLIDPATKSEALERLIADLDDNSFDRRQKAAAELQRLGRIAEPALKRALQGKPPLEVRHRAAEELLRKMLPETYVHARDQRAVEVLELINNEESRKLLTQLASGARDSPITQEAQAAVERLGKP